MNLTAAVLGILAAGFLLWGPLFKLKGPIQADASISDSSKHVSIDSNQQAVILRGVVLNETDKDRVESLAGQYAGVRQVDSHLTVKDGETDAAGGHHIVPATRNR